MTCKCRIVMDQATFEDVIVHDTLHALTDQLAEALRPFIKGSHTTAMQHMEIRCFRSAEAEWLLEQYDRLKGER